MTTNKYVPESFSIPDTIEGVGLLLKARKWEKAAIVWAYVHCSELGENQYTVGAKTSTLHDKAYTPESFAALEIAGLRSKDTVRAYWRAWQDAIDQGEAEPVSPGDTIRVPGLPWSPTPSPQARPKQEQAAPAPKPTREQIAEAIKADPEVAKAAQSALREKSEEAVDSFLADRGTSPEAIEAIAEKRKAEDLAARKGKGLAHTAFYMSVGGDLGSVYQRLRKVLNETTGFDAEDFTELEREILADQIGKVRALLGLVEMRVAGTADVDWDAELAKIAGGEV